MLAQQVVSITDLRMNTAKILNEDGIKYVFVNNKPKSVIMDIKHFEAIKQQLKKSLLDKETKHAKKNGPYFDNVDDLMKDLFE